MVRETRATRATVTNEVSPPMKRKRRSSPSPVKVENSHTPVTSLKVIIPSPSSLSKGPNGVNHPQTNGDTEHDPKRQRISLRIVKHVDTEPSKVEDSVDDEEDAEEEEVEEPVEMPEESPVVETSEKSRSHPLSPPVRAALALVIEQMAVKLPPPLNKCLTLWLPPKFAKTEDNTLGYVLRQEDLTWEALVDLLHIFAENLLVPCSYPNPMPSLAQFHLPAPELPSYYSPHAIYTFCASLRVLMQQIAPLEYDSSHSERWALTQRGVGPGHGDWFTSSVDMRTVDKSGTVKTESLLEDLAGNGNSFAGASAVNIQSSIANASGPSRTLNQSLVRQASLKMGEWKRLAKAHRGGSFGSIKRGVTPLASKTAYTPSFAPTFDSSSATGGGGYYSAMDEVMVLSRASSAQIQEGDGWWGTLDAEGSSSKGKHKAQPSIEDVLEDNVQMIEELVAWQQVRAGSKSTGTPSERESLVAEELLASLARLAEAARPGDWTEPRAHGKGHSLARRFIPIHSPNIRGILDPRRPKAMHESATLRLRSNPSPSPNPASAMGTSPSSFANRSTYLPAPPRSTSNGFRSTGPGPYNPYTPSTTSSTIYGRTALPITPKSTPSMLNPRGGPGPSGLRQSFASDPRVGQLG